MRCQGKSWSYLKKVVLYLEKCAIYLDIMTTDEAQTLAAQAATVFQPRTPITIKELFAGRWEQLTTVADAVTQPGLHVVIYGERGVGKTSLANVVKPTIWALDNIDKPEEERTERLVIKVNTSAGDQFSDIWEKLFKDLTWQDNGPTIGILPNHRKQTPITEAFGFDPDHKLSVDDVRRVLANMPGAVFIIDEFDRSAHETSQKLTDLVKVLSDLAIDCTVILVGVAETVDRLIADHASVSRAVIQVLVPRMGPKELREILTNAESKLSVNFSPDAGSFIVHVSQGLPHYAHLLGLNAVRIAALTRASRSIDQTDVFKALKEAVRQAQQSVSEKCSKATHSSHKEALYRQVLLACALTAARSHDSWGYFAPSDVVDHLNTILEREDVQIATFTNHLGEFCQPKRGEVLEREGQPRAYRFRFRDPLLVPYIFMDAVATGLVSDNALTSLLGEPV
jgi:Cdc6-like AAA superfamily ATPase